MSQVNSPNNYKTSILLFGNSVEYTIITGQIQINANTGLIKLDTESDASTDTLNTIAGGNIGQLIVLTAENAARVVTVADGVFKLPADFVLTTVNETLILIKTAEPSEWTEISRSTNS